MSVNDLKGVQGEAKALKQHVREMEDLAPGLETGSTTSFQNFGESHRQL